MKLYKKVIDGVNHCKPASKIILIKDEMQIFNPTEEMLIEEGWVECVDSIQEISEQEIARNEAIDEVSRLKEEIASTDYKVIKCMEAFLCSEELPYNINELHLERNSLRNKINNLENLL